MRAAIVSELGSAPRVDEQWPEPERAPGQALVAVHAAPINPVDLKIAAGTFYAGVPTVPYVPGTEGVGEVLESDGLARGARVRFEGAGALAERVAVQDAACVELPPEVDEALAAGLGVAGVAAWLALEWRARLAPGETVLVLGASGAVGQVAIQSARALKAGRIVAAGRSEQGLEHARALGADEVVTLADGLDTEQLADRLREAAGSAIDVIVDPLWGAPAVAAARAAGYQARLVQLGDSAGSEAPLASGDVRGKMLSILGHTNVFAPPEVKRDAYMRLVELAAEGRMQLPSEIVRLDAIADAWERQATSPQVKLIVDPRG